MNSSGFSARQCAPGDLPEVIRLLDRVFRPDGTSSMGREFPVFLSPANCAGLWIVEDGPRVVSHAGVDYVTMDVEGAEVKVGMIGAVATDEPYRGKGLATVLLDAMRVDARSRGVGFFMISGGRGLYTRRGARPAGSIPQFRMPFDVWRPWRHGKVTWRPALPGDAGLIMAWYAEQNPRFSRTEAAIAQVIMANCCGNRTSIAMMNNGPVGYAVATASDGQVHVLETGGDEAIAAALPGTCGSGFEGELVVSLTRQHPFASAIGRLAGTAAGIERVKAAFGGTAEWVDFEACVAQLKPYWERHGLAAMRGAATATGLELTDGRDTVRLEPPEMIEFFWGAPTTTAPAVPSQWRAAVPVPLRMYGLNYI